MLKPLPKMLKLLGKMLVIHLQRNDVIKKMQLFFKKIVVGCILFKKVFLYFARAIDGANVCVCVCVCVCV